MYRVFRTRLQGGLPAVRATLRIRSGRPVTAAARDGRAMLRHRADGLVAFFALGMPLFCACRSHPLAVRSDAGSEPGLACSEGFTPPVTYSTGSSFHLDSVQVADLDADGHPDLAWAGWTTTNRTDVPSLGVLLNREDGTFSDQFLSTTSSGSLVVADFNGDSRLDLAAIQPSSFSVGVSFNQGKGVFADPVDYPAGDGRAPPTGLVVGDLNGDHFPDLAFGHFVDAADSIRYQLGVFLNAGDGTLVTIPIVDAHDFVIESFAIADINGDGAGDIVASHGGSPAAIAVFLANGAGTFSSPVTLDGGNCKPAVASNIVVADFDRDGRPDLAFSCDNQLRVFLNHGDPELLEGPVSYPGSPSVPIMANYYPTSAVGDLNADGFLDVAVRDGASSTVSLFFNRGDGTFVGPTVVATGDGSTPGAVAIADLDGNGFPDIVLVNTDTISVLLSKCSP